jgi:opacity protein-like surface antigen
MSKKILAVAAVALLSTVASATSKNMTGFYAGVNVGAGAGKTRITQSNGDRDEVGTNGFLGGFLFGYQRDLGSLVGGLEAGFDLSNQKASARVGTTSTTFKKRDSWNLALRMGTKINSWLVYVKAGYESAKFRYTETNIRAESKRHGAFVPGIGMETMLTNNVLFGGEFTYASYSRKTYRNSNHRIRPHTADFKLRLGYKF